MTTVQRFDFSRMGKARKTDEGYLFDSPIVGRIGIQEYVKADGSIRRELRLPDEVFNTDSLNSFLAKPITVGHPSFGLVTSKEFNSVSIGTILSIGRRDSNNVATDIVIHSPEKMGENRELSLGYNTDLDETPGEWEGQKYDAIQRNIRINHLSVVKVGRAGVAKLNIDGNETASINETKLEGNLNMPKIKIDNGIEYEALAEVAVAYTQKQDALQKAEAEKKVLETTVAKLEAERDTQKAKLDGFDAAVATAVSKIKADAIERVELEKVAEGFKVDCAGKTSRQVKEAVIKAVRSDANFEGKSDVYIDAAFDFAKESQGQFNMNEQRKSVFGEVKKDANGEVKRNAYDQHMYDLANPKK